MIVTFPKIVVEQYANEYNVNLSESFLECLNINLSAEFKLLTGFSTSSNKIQFSFIDASKFWIAYNDISKMTVTLFINHNWINYVVCWQSKSGKLYKVEDEVPDCADIRFWFDNMDVEVVRRCMAPADGLPFTIKNLSFELVVYSLDMDLELHLHFLNNEVPENYDSVIEQIDSFISLFNQKSEKSNRKDGIVHNWKRRLENNVLVYNLDIGSAGVAFLAKLFKHLNTMPVFSKVEVGPM